MAEPATGSLLEAMLAVQAEAPTLPKDRTVTVKSERTGKEFSYNYTPLDTIVEKVRPLLTANGLVWSTRPSNDEAGTPILKYRLAHAPSGESIDDQMHLVIDDDHRQDVQALGSAITYTRRYALCAVLDLVADADDDGRAAGGGRGSMASASDKQKAFLRRLITQNRLDATVMDALFKGVGFVREDGEKVNDAINRLLKDQCSTLIETIKDGAVPTGESDVPGYGAGEFKHPEPSEEDRRLLEGSGPS